MKGDLKFLIVLIFISITLFAVWNVSLGQKTHDQPPTTFTKISGTGSLAVNYYSNPKLVDHGYVLNKDDKVCVGDVLKISSTDLGGEWFGKGGPSDSPPITWVTADQLKQIIDKWNKSQTLTPEDIKEILGTEITTYQTPLYSGPGRTYVWAYGTLICTANSEITFNEQLYAGDEIPVSDEGQLQFDVTSKPTCYYYLKSFGSVQNQLSNLIQGPTISTTINLVAVKDSNGPNLEISRFSLSPDNYVRLLVTNNGGMTGKLDYVGSNVPLSVYNTPEIQPGQTWEIFGKLQTSESVDEDSLKFNLFYRSNELGCLKIKEYGVSGEVVSSACQSDGDCTSGLICCQELCRNPSVGTCKDVNGDGIPDWVPYES